MSNSKLLECGYRNQTELRQVSALLTLSMSDETQIALENEFLIIG
jgi:hypothetical protein